MEGIALLKMISALGVVIAMMFGFGLLAKKAGLAGPQIMDRSKRRLKFIEALPLDGKRRLVLVSCDERQHLLVLGANSETVVDTDIPAIETKAESSDDLPHAKTKPEEKKRTAPRFS